LNDLRFLTNNTIIDIFLFPTPTYWINYNYLLGFVLMIFIFMDNIFTLRTDRELRFAALYEVFCRLFSYVEKYISFHSKVLKEHILVSKAYLQYYDYLLAFVWRSLITIFISMISRLWQMIGSCGFHYFVEFFVLFSVMLTNIYHSI
jgi:hypothetical protein